MNDIITVRGFVASEVKTSTTPGGIATASFRMGSTERRFDRVSNTWTDGNTNWFTVQSFRHLAGHVGCSIKKGQRVIVLGKLRLRQWERDGRIYHVAEIDAESVGHDLMWGSANFTRMASNSGQQAAAEHGTGESGGGEVEEPPVDDEAGGSGTALEVLTGEDGEPALVDSETGELLDASA
ncbi:single-stranded DNA-binding protein [Arthrobacter sp. SW1]|uniref:single-stranded DNA-binding protein n=1 Tax=Arthrobacter sp. SW1 TaxID=1920889 RepID=UPI000877D4FE|nr:single-stranded DNA-binding protein [Arthrobacter sp. SW1]OFI39591.1 single-stranded DNA-binding protein [Arthrobacter sp. SW1]